ncbi:hypothetical protein L2E82_33436 [Cichorium intybus]|uniref:Uncharacterized protein n=1 Tax=Cichorium intybus TaxID=13427 RepID=A0ACB9BK55_CICIN|nr:hypothetical protein L2E82_33436 [Cichorium intybus]
MEQTSTRQCVIIVCHITRACNPDNSDICMSKIKQSQASTVYHIDIQEDSRASHKIRPYPGWQDNLTVKQGKSIDARNKDDMNTITDELQGVRNTRIMNLGTWMPRKKRYDPASVAKPAASTLNQPLV